MKLTKKTLVGSFALPDFPFWYRCEEVEEICRCIDGRGSACIDYQLFDCMQNLGYTTSLLTSKYFLYWLASKTN